jgi:hypothetical protein
LTNQELYDLLREIIQKKDKDRLHLWIKATTGYHIPRVSICAHHCAPFDFIADAIFDEFRQCIAHANRSGGKTQGVAIIEAVKTFATSNLEAANVGAIQAQADRCYGYIKEINEARPFSANAKSLTATKGLFENGSYLQILPGTPKAVNSPHPQLLVLDELELMPFFVVQQALSMAQSKAGIPAITIITSTVKFATGLMMRMIGEFKERHLPVYSWCCWEVMQPLPTDNPKLLATIREVFGDELPPNMDEADGYYDWQDLINKKQTLDPETWSVEWVCNEPERSGLVYPQFSLDANVINPDHPKKRYRADYTPNPFLPIYILEDFGFGKNNPNVNLFAQVVQDELVIFDEIYNRQKISRENVADAVEKLEHDYGLTVVRTLQADGTFLYSFPKREVIWICDPAGLTEIEERKQMGLTVLEAVLDRSFYQLKQGIPVLRKKITDRSLQIGAKCVNLIEEYLSYRNKKDKDGQYTDEPEKKSDHGPDATRYGVLRLFSVLAQAQFESTPSTPEDKPLTAGLRNKTF